MSSDWIRDMVARDLHYIPPIDPLPDDMEFRRGATEEQLDQLLTHLRDVEKARDVDGRRSMRLTAIALIVGAAALGAPLGLAIDTALRNKTQLWMWVFMFCFAALAGAYWFVESSIARQRLRNAVRQEVADQE